MAAAMLVAGGLLLWLHVTPSKPAAPVASLNLCLLHLLCTLRPSTPLSTAFRSYAALDGHLHFVDCGDRFIVPGGGAIRADLMQDALHPNAAGKRLRG